MTNLVMKANDNSGPVYGDCILPLPPLDPADTLEMEIYGRFMRHIRLVPNSRMEIKILSAIQFTSDMMDFNDALISKMLVDMGLRAPRSAFPETYLEHVDRSLGRSGWDIGAPCASTLALRTHWSHIGDPGMVAARGKFSAYLDDPLAVQ